MIHRYNIALVLRLSGDRRERKREGEGGKEKGGEGSEGEEASYSALSICCRVQKKIKIQ